jgi:hypothetical protein
VTQVHDRLSRRQAQWCRKAANDRTNDGFDPIDELNVALFAIADVGQSIQNADTKSGMLGALLGLTIAGATSQLTLVRTTLTTTGVLHHVAVALLAAFTASLFAAGLFLGLTQIPRLGTPQRVRRLAFPALARGLGHYLRPPGVLELRDEAWCQAEALARIALRKFRYLRASLLCSGVCVVSFLTWLGLSSTIA